MKFKPINQRGWGLMDLIFWVALITVGFWIYKQYILHPEGLNARGATHSQYEDGK